MRPNRLGQAKSRIFCVAAIGDEEIGGLDVAMDDAFGVGGIEGIGDADGESSVSIDWQPACPWITCFSVSTLQELHGDEGPADSHRRCRRWCRCWDDSSAEAAARFALEALESPCGSAEFIAGEISARRSAELRVLGFIDDAHAPAAEFFDDAIVGDCAADQGLGVRHLAGILRLKRSQVNVAPAFQAGMRGKKLQRQRKSLVDRYVN